MNDFLPKIIHYYFCIQIAIYKYKKILKKKHFSTLFLRFFYKTCATEIGDIEICVLCSQFLTSLDGLDGRKRKIVYNVLTLLITN